MFDPEQFKLIAPSFYQHTTPRRGKPTVAVKQNVVPRKPRTLKPSVQALLEKLSALELKSTLPVGIERRHAYMAVKNNKHNPLVAGKEFLFYRTSSTTCKIKRVQ